MFTVKKKIISPFLHYIFFKQEGSLAETPNILPKAKGGKKREGGPNQNLLKD